MYWTYNKESVGSNHAVLCHNCGRPIPPDEPCFDRFEDRSVLGFFYCVDCVCRRLEAS